MKRVLYISSIVALLAVTLSACSGCSFKVKTNEDMVSGDTDFYCDETFSNVLKQHVDVFESGNDATIRMTALPEADVLDAVMSGDVRLAALSRPLTKTEQQKLQDEHKLVYNDTHVGVDAIAFVVNKANPDSVLTTHDIHRILTGEVTQWKELFPNSKLGEILVIFDNERSSTVRYAVDSICSPQALHSGVTAADSTLHLVSEVARRHNAIGVMGAAWVGSRDKEGNRIKNVVAPVRIKKSPDAQAFGPFQAFIVSAEYPYFRSIYMINTGGKTGLTTGFSIFVAGQRGQKIFEKTNISPARIHERELNIKSEF